MERKETIKLALADDHTLFRMGLVTILKNYDEIEVLFHAANGRELIEKVNASATLPDVCLIDINMPVMHGYDTVRYLRKHYPKILLLALTIYDSDANIIKMLRSGANGYLLKDCEPAQLVEAVKELKEHGFYHTELITNKMLRHARTEDKDENPLSEKELQFLKYVCSEMTYKQIAIEMEVSERTADGYRERVFEKMGVKSRTGLIIKALRQGLVDIY